MHIAIILSAVEQATQNIVEEYQVNRTLARPITSPREGAAFIQEQLDDLWVAVREGDIACAREVAIGVAAHALAFTLEAKALH